MNVLISRPYLKLIYGDGDGFTYMLIKHVYLILLGSDSCSDVCAGLQPSPNSASSVEAKEKSDAMPNISDVMLRKLKLHRGLPGWCVTNQPAASVSFDLFPNNSKITFVSLYLSYSVYKYVQYLPH